VITSPRLVTAAVLIGLLSSPWPARAQGCPSSNVADVLKDPRVQEVMAEAWNDSREGQPDEHEEGGWIYQCQMPNGDGTFRYYTDVRRWPSGGEYGIDASAPRLTDPTCRLVADFHTHPGGGVTASGRPENPGADGAHNWEASPADRAQSAENGIPGIIRYGSGSETTDFTYGYNGMEAPRDPSWSCPGDENSDGWGFGDPHVKSLDGYTFDFQAIGNFVYVAAARGDFELHVQQQPYKQLRHASMNTAVAVRDGADRVEWSIDSPDPLLNGISRPLAIGRQIQLRSRGFVKRAADGYLFVSSVGDRLRVVPGTVMVDFYLRPAPHRRGALRGLLGNFDGDRDNDFRSADGTTVALKFNEPMEAKHPLYAVFGESWRAPAAGGLIVRALSTELDPRAFPEREPAISADALTAAQARCAERGIRDEAIRAACAFDLAATGNDAFAVSAAEANKAAEQVRQSTGRPIALDVEVSGTLDKRGAQVGRDERVLYTLRLDAGAYIFDATGSERTSWTLTGPEGASLFDARRSRAMGEEPVRLTLTRSGVYKIAVSVRYEMLDGAYRFRVTKAPSP
jgi:hypothetical protein